MTRPHKVLVAFLAAMSILWLTALPAAAHTRLLASDPSDGATIARLPAALVLTFNEPPVALGTKIVVTGPNGQVQTGPAQLLDNTVRQALQPDAPAGSYEVLWRVSSDDGHPVSGHLGFTVRAAVSKKSSVDASPTATSEPASPLPLVPHQGSGSPGDTVLWVAAGLVALAAIAYFLLRLRRPSDRGQ